MKEWTAEKAMDIVCSVIKEEVAEDAMSDRECEALAAKIVAALEGEE